MGPWPQNKIESKPVTLPRMQPSMNQILHITKKASSHFGNLPNLGFSLLGFAFLFTPVLTRVGAYLRLYPTTPTRQSMILPFCTFVACLYFLLSLLVTACFSFNVNLTFASGEAYILKSISTRFYL